MSQRRELRFSSLDEVQADLDRLLSGGYVKTGNWDLSQMANHLADWMAFPIDGFPKMPWFIGIMIGLMRMVQGKSLYKTFVQNQRMSEGQPTIPQTVHSNPSDATEAVSRLKRAIDRLKSHRGPLHPSPLYGNLNYDEAVALQLAHCAHHLSFLVPR